MQVWLRVGFRVGQIKNQKQFGCERLCGI